MKKYIKVDPSEAHLEELVRIHCAQIEKDLVYVDHQVHTGAGRLDMLMVNGSNALVVAELKVIPDDEMLAQGLDYYDYISTHVESLARIYKNHPINPSQAVRLFLIAPDFSPTLLNRCKWMAIPIQLFTFSCLKFEDDDEFVPIFAERDVPVSPVAPTLSSVEDQLAYITNEEIRTEAKLLLDEARTWKPGSILLVSVKTGASMKISNKVFAYLYPRRQHFVIGTYDADDQWADFSVKGSEDITQTKNLMKAAMEKRSK